MRNQLLAVMLSAVMAAGLAGCGGTAAQTTTAAAASTAATTAAAKAASTAGAATTAAASKAAASQAGAATAAAGKATGLKFVYICKQLTHPWFIQEEMGIKKACTELGIDYVGIDSNNNNEKCLSDIDSAFSMNADGMMICITNQSMGPNLAKRCREEGMPLVTIDDNIVDDTGAPVPHVGMPTEEVGELGGKELAKMANERGFFKDGNVVKVMQINIPTNTVFGPRLDGYKKALMADTPLKDEDFIRVDAADATAEYEGNLKVASPVILAHPEVTHWIITGANDDCALAPMAVLKEQGFNQDNVLGCGLGGYEMSLEQFKNGNKSYIAIVLQPDVEGYKAVYELYENITKKTAMPDNTFVSGSIANSDNYLDYYPNGKLMTDQ